MKAGRVVHSENYSTDGIEYALQVIVRGKLLLGRWDCRSCRTHGESEVRGRWSWEAAISEAKLDLHPHHSITHLGIGPGA